MYPETRIEGICQSAIRCVNCGADVTPFKFTNGYTIAFDVHRQVGVTLPKQAAEQVARDGRRYLATPDHSIQNPIVTFAPHDIVGAVARLRPFLGQIGTTPSRPLPDSHNAGDFGFFLIGAPHKFAVSAAELLGMTVPEVTNRATITGSIEIGRHPGVVTAIFRVPVDRLEKLGIMGYVREQCHL
ncbi:acetamidase/formamidase [Alicyclobacillus cycloheptanicus]|uniref:Acetamidase/formamidase n=1 Tax=Alicyclobacillus cycloheptanicus TaxID=1457 RepID=A0ABT9XHT7_9BACL|nr:acetamidase/formamidase [Alicyclobacillus cycloheptanicus]